MDEEQLFLTVWMVRNGHHKVATEWLEAIAERIGSGKVLPQSERTFLFLLLQGIAERGEAAQFLSGGKMPDERHRLEVDLGFFHRVDQLRAQGSKKTEAIEIAGVEFGFDDEFKDDPGSDWIGTAASRYDDVARKLRSTFRGIRETRADVDALKAAATSHKKSAD